MTSPFSMKREIVFPEQGPHVKCRVWALHSEPGKTVSFVVLRRREGREGRSTWNFPKQMEQRNVQVEELLLLVLLLLLFVVVVP